jgi:hypothetical protein
MSGPVTCTTFPTSSMSMDSHWVKVVHQFDINQIYSLVLAKLVFCPIKTTLKWTAQTEKLKAGGRQGIAVHVGDSRFQTCQFSADVPGDI